MLCSIFRKNSETLRCLHGYRVMYIRCLVKGVPRCRDASRRGFCGWFLGKIVFDNYYNYCQLVRRRLSPPFDSLLTGWNNWITDLLICTANVENAAFLVYMVRRIWLAGNRRKVIINKLLRTTSFYVTLCYVIVVQPKFSVPLVWN